MSSSSSRAGASPAASSSSHAKLPAEFFRGPVGQYDVRLVALSAFLPSAPVANARGLPPVDLAPAILQGMDATLQR